nr:AMP-binding protein [Lachnospiraceae bacterium]
MNWTLELIRRAVTENPDLLAVIVKDESLTFAELWDYSKKAASKLKRAGVCKGDRITLELSRGPRYVGFMLGSWMIGAVFAALDSAYPADRLELIAKDCGAKIRVNDEFLIGVEKDIPMEDFEELEELDPSLIIYTSGSTGMPKGVLHSHRGIFESVKRNIKAVENSGVPYRIRNIHLAPFSFVVGIISVLTPLAMGSTYYTVPYDVMRDPQKLADFIEDNKIVCAYISPKMLRIFTPRSNILRFAFTGSERVSGVYRDDFRILNGYGSSESAGGVLFFDIDKAYDNTPIGKPAGDEKVYILDEDGKEASEGELCLSGYFALGYLNRPEESAKTFTPNPFESIDGFSTMLHTGDIVRKLPDGNIVYLNRKDWMVKINGQRVEPGEIEGVIRNFDGVLDVAVKDFEGNNQQRFLCAYYTVKEGETVTDEALRKHSEEKLPEYMIPAFFIHMETLPLNANGKLDRKALPRPETDRFRAAYAAPENEHQKKITDSFEKVLGIEKISLDDNFFSLGGDSIKVMMLQNELQSNGISLSAKTIFELRTPRLISEAKEEVSDLSVFKSREAESYPLTKAQMSIFLDCQIPGKETAYNNVFGLFLPNDMQPDPKKLRSVVREVIGRYPILTSVTRIIDGIPSLVPQIGSEIDIKVIDAVTRDHSVLAKNINTPFDLEKDIPC